MAQGSKGGEGGAPTPKGTARSKRGQEGKEEGEGREKRRKTGTGRGRRGQKRDRGEEDQGGEEKEGPETRQETTDEKEGIGVFIATWNVQKKPGRYFGASVEEILGLGDRRRERARGSESEERGREGAQDSDTMIVMLQEATEWAEFNKRKYKNAVYYNAEGSGAGILAVGMDPKNIKEVMGGEIG